MWIRPARHADALPRVRIGSDDFPGIIATLPCVQNALPATVDAPPEISLALLILGAFILQRRLGVRPAPAAAMSLLILCSMASQIAVTTIRGDLLGAALSLWGVMLCAGVDPSRKVFSADDVLPA